MKIEINDVRQGFLEYEDMGGKKQFACVTEWDNGEGYDIAFSDEKIIQLHRQEIDAMMTLIHYLET